jgi:hypothetical protein
MSIRLSGAQVVRIKEALFRFDDNFGKIPPKLRYEDLVEDILKEVLPPCPPVESRSVSQSANV